MTLAGVLRVFKNGYYRDVGLGVLVGADVAPIERGIKTGSHDGGGEGSVVLCFAVLCCAAMRCDVMCRGRVNKGSTMEAAGRRKRLQRGAGSC